MEIPTLIVAPEREPRGTVFWFHGFGPGVDKETHRPELTRLANAGFLAVGVDAAGHGQRRDPELAVKQAAPRDQARAAMLEYVEETAHDVSRLLDRFGPAALAGVSMGAFVVYRAAALDPRIRTAVAILGEPLWPIPDHVALLSITAGRDVNVPPDTARAFHAHRRGQHRYLELPGEEHLMSAEGWERTMHETLAWLQSRIAVAAPPL
ncbi:MAG TPA: alpha/beta fold hydrolase [Thermoanaerobaculia bacterium]|jgi:hypothetical protein